MYVIKKPLLSLTNALSEYSASSLHDIKTGRVKLAFAGLLLISEAFLQYVSGVNYTFCCRRPHCAMVLYKSKLKLFIKTDFSSESGTRVCSFNIVCAFVFRSASNRHIFKYNMYPDC